MWKEHNNIDSNSIATGKVKTIIPNSRTEPPKRHECSEMLDQSIIIFDLPDKKENLLFFKKSTD